MYDVKRELAWNKVILRSVESEIGLRASKKLQVKCK
jgi:hypothetical protein